MIVERHGFCRIKSNFLACTLSYFIGSSCDLCRRTFQTQIGIIHVNKVCSSPYSDLCAIRIKDSARSLFVFAQQVDNVLSGIALELVGKGKDLAKDLGTDVAAKCRTCHK